MTPPLPARAWPSGLTLLVLILAVLGAHLVLLSGGLPSWSHHTPAASAPGPAKTSDIPPQTTTAADAVPPRPAAVLTSQVRWIAPPVTQPAAASPPEPPVVEAVAPQPRPRPPPAPSAPAPEASSITATPLPEPERLPETPAIEHPPDPDHDPVVAPAQAPSATPEPVNEAPQTADTFPGPTQPPASAQLSYSVEGQSKGLTYSASGSLDWRNEGSTYTARIEIRVFLLGSRVQTSQGQLAATGLQPERFGDKSRSERAAHFDRSQNRIRFSNNAPDAELLAGAQDRLSVFLQLASLLNARPEAFGAGQNIDIPVAGTSGSEIWRFQVQDLASLDLPAGSLIARHLVREPREPRDTRVDIWLAPSLSHLPVRIRLTQDNGDVVDQRLSALP